MEQRKTERFLLGDEGLKLAREGFRENRFDWNVEVEV